jgi:8-oxo-dGTP pyrophosphatase MutT (NUDIX family)
MRISEAAFALITRVNAQGEAEYLTQWNEKWHAYSMIGGHREEGESFRECCIREVQEELGLVPGSDIHIADTPLRPADEFTEFSQSTQVQTRYSFELFAVEKLSAASMVTVDANRQNRWLTEKEIRELNTKEGQPVAAQVVRVLSLCN